MPRGKYYPEEMREEAGRLRREGCSLNEISAKLGPPKNTLTLWVRGIKLTPEQQNRLHEKEVEAIGRNRALAAMVNREARLARIRAEEDKAEALFIQMSDPRVTNHIAAAMLYLGEGDKGENAFGFANSNPNIIRYWLYLLRTSFAIDESKFRIQIMSRADQDQLELQTYWAAVTGIRQFTKGTIDARTIGELTKRDDYKGVCRIRYHDVSIRRYLDAVAHGLMARALGEVA